jgi:hypothetical protein
MSFRDKVGTAWDVATEKATIAGVEVELRAMSVADKARLVKDGSKDGLVQLEKWNPLIVLLCAYDPETGERAFTDDDLEWLQSRPADLIADLAAKCSSISAMSEKPIDEGKDGS